MPKLSYANVMSTIAVFLALGGTSYAVARNSVGTAQLRNSAVTSEKIRNATIQRKDLSAAARVGSRGPRGALGAPGAAGAAGARGPSDGYIDGGPEQPLPTAANVGLVVAQLADLPAGSYVMAAEAQIGDFVNAGSIVSCDIRVNGQSVGGSSVVVGVNPGSTRVSVSSQMAGVTQTATFGATLECRTDQALGQPPTIQNQHLSAIRVETLKAT